MSERRYNEDEVAAIFANAADVQEVNRRKPGAARGLTLAELQEIGQEAGIAPDAVAHAAGLVDRAPAPAAPTARRFLGLPIGVGRTVELGRELSEAEWERLVVDLRETFDARGVVSGHGSFRQWTNGNLQALLEPTPTGHRLRLKTVKGSSRSLVMIGLGGLGFSAVTFVAGMLFPVGPEALESVGSIALIGAGFIGAGTIQLPSWARTRGRQMDDVIARLTQRTAIAPPAQDP